MFLFGSFRLFCLVVKKDWQHIFFDSLLFAGIGYVAAYVLLRLTAGYYLVPSVVLFAPSLVYWLNHLFQKENRQSLRTLCLFFIFLFVFAFGLGTASRRIGRTWRERTEFMPYMESLFLEYKNGKEFIWYESDITGFAIQIRNWKKSIENAFLNYLNRSEGIEFFSIHNNTEDLVLDETILFFYPSDNNQGRPMPESLVETLGDNNFVLYKDSYDVLIFKKKL